VSPSGEDYCLQHGMIKAGLQRIENSVGELRSEVRDVASDTGDLKIDVASIKAFHRGETSGIHRVHRTGRNVRAWVGLALAAVAAIGGFVGWAISLQG